MKTNVGGGLVMGFVMASFYSLYVVILYVLRGAAPFESNGVSLPGIVAAYYAAGLTGGAIVGAMSPLLRWRLGATIVGIAAGLVFFLSIGLATDGYFSRWTSRTWETVIVLGTLLGAICSNMVWRRPGSQ